MKPLAVDLFCGLGGWTEGLLAEGYDVIGFDIERHQYGDEKYPAHLVLQDVLTIHGKQLRDASLIVASPPCQKYSYMAMPWTKAKQIAAEYRSGVRSVEELNELFNACFRIQREACEAAGRHIPMVVENVKGAQPWVGRSRWNFGSFHLWGDVPALMPMVKSRAATKVGGVKWYHQTHPRHVPGQGFNNIDDRNLRNGIKNNGGSWFNIGSPGQTQVNCNPVHGIAGAERERERERENNGTKNKDADGYIRNHPQAFGWKIPRTSSRGNKRKKAAAMIAKIPLDLSRHIARTYLPKELSSVGPVENGFLAKGKYLA